ncbi:unnamed protein product [Pleuronectes platessa]|uniref:Uncharacterized protein n=1 Tax=Pleuronectes platessa TaxID=8262 RepID=A0A9N7VHG7_PLEPL|nr:unnamed protein product [Pleuronectes platessa]
MCELGIYSVSRPHTDKGDRSGEGGMDGGRGRMWRRSKEGGDTWQERKMGELWGECSAAVKENAMCAKWSISVAWPGPASPSGPHMVNVCECYMHGRMAWPSARLLPTG